MSLYPCLEKNQKIIFDEYLGTSCTVQKVIARSSEFPMWIAKFVSLYNGQHLSHLQMFVCCILDYNLRILLITGV